MPDEQLGQAAIPDPQQDPSAENPVEQSEVSPAPQPDYAAQLAALQSQLDREKERRELVEQSLRIQERFLQREEPKPQPAQPQQGEWTQELEVLQKALEPILSQERKHYEPLAQGYGQALDELDSVKFENYLARNQPEVLDDEDLYAKTMQQVEAVRQAARQRGINISRVDAMVFSTGLEGTKQKLTERKQRRSKAGSSEAQRQAEVRVAAASGSGGEPRPNANAGIAAIRQKIQARGKAGVTPEEWRRFQDYVGNTEL